MLLSWPKSMGFDNIRGSTFDQPVEIRDILPTFLDAAGEPVPASLDGRSLLNLVRGKKDDWRPFIDIEHSACYAKLTDYHALVNNEHKYIYHACSGREQLFDLKNDPGELHNLADNPDSQKLLRQWRNRLVKHLAERGKPFVDGDKLLIRKSSMLYGPNYPGSTGQG